MGPTILFLTLILLSIISCGEQSTSSASEQPISVLEGAKTPVEEPLDTVITPKSKRVKDTLVKVNSDNDSHKSHSNTKTEHQTTTASNYSSYSWMDRYDKNTSIQNQVPTPSEYKRIPLGKTSFGTWLRGLSLLPKKAKVLLFNGQEKPYQQGAYRVLDIDIGSRDLQQCADAIMRLVAEYHYSKKNYAAIHFNYTSGHSIRFSDWSKGKKPFIKGSNVRFSAFNNRTNTSYKNFKKYLTNVYCYAGTASLSKELRSKAVSDISLGDIFIWGSFPGHAVMVMDVAQHQTTGKKIFLLAQSYMPAQSIHLLQNFNDSLLSPWYSEDFGPQLLTPEWTFDRNTLKTFDLD
ncbi:MAG: Unknown protein [uncultured Aureispira sp.]|uniref:DUF4846 domain-containing protein n=1 Tax=uncultured Aureispira sp. TaxID=1331704 RepID=A0A6S6U6Q9_9BACT|nr:MAG: Unknown protein [uncultured Aureispira sp.]